MEDLVEGHNDDYEGGLKGRSVNFSVCLKLVSTISDKLTFITMINVNTDRMF